MKIRRIAVGFMSLLVLSNLTACSDDDVESAIGAAAIIGGALVIANNTHCESGYVTRCTEHRDYWGTYHRQCREIYDSCAYLAPGQNHSGRHGNSMDVMSAEVNEDRVNEVNWAVAFGMGIGPAEKLLGALKAARDGSPYALKDLGLTESDLSRISAFNMPDMMSVREVAKNINQDVVTTERVLYQLLAETREEVIRRQRAGLL